MRSTTLLAAATLGAATLAAAAAGSGPASQYEVLDGAGDPFRSAFNADQGNVRIVALVAPT